MPIRLDIPSYPEVRDMLRTAMHDPDPISRAEAVAELTVLNLPVSPEALVMVAKLQRDAALAG